MCPLKWLAAAVLLASVTSPSWAESDDFAWRDSEGRVVPDTDSQKSESGFGVQLVLTKNLDLYEDWKKPKTPVIETAEKAAIGDPVVVAVVFVNPAKNERGEVKVVCDLETIRPDGSVEDSTPNIPVADGKIRGPKFNLRLAKTQIRWSVGHDEPPGMWKVKVVVKDVIRGVALPLEEKIELATK